MLYVSGEESERQIKMRGERLASKQRTSSSLPETNLENIFHEIERLKPGAIIVDSIQTVFSSAIESAPGSVSQVREVAHQFLLLAKNRGIPIFLIGTSRKMARSLVQRPRAHRRYGLVFRRRAPSQPSHRARREEPFRRGE